MLDRIKRFFTREEPEEKPTAGGEQTPQYTQADQAGLRAEHGMITRKCKKCGKTFTLPEEVQHWPDYCQECRRKYRIVEDITRTCRGCGKEFTFPSNVWHWPNYCRECQAKRKRRRRSR